MKGAIQYADLGLEDLVRAPRLDEGFRPFFVRCHNKSQTNFGFLRAAAAKLKEYYDSKKGVQEKWGIVKVFFGAAKSETKSFSPAPPLYTARLFS